MKYKKIYNYITPLIFSLLLLTWGCSKTDEAINTAVKNGTISVSIRNAAGAITTLDEGLKLGLTIYSKDNYEWGYTDFNFPYTLQNGIVIPDDKAISIPDGFSEAWVGIYGPYRSYDDFWVSSRYPQQPLPAFQYPPYTTVNLVFGVESDQRTAGTASSDLVWGVLPSYKGAGQTNQVVLNHKCCKIKIKLTSELDNDLSDAKVTLVGVFAGGRLKFSDGTFETSNVTRSNITAYHNPDGTYELIVPAQTLRNAEDLILVEVGDKSYVFRNKAEKKLTEGAEYLFELTVKDKGDLPFTVIITYDTTKTLGDKLSIGSSATQYDITMSEIPNSGEGLSYTSLKIRNGGGDYCWAKLGNTHALVSDREIINHQIRYAYILFEENLSPTPRSMVLEFYNTTSPKFVHKRVLIEQAGLSGDYLTLSTPTLSVDKWGNLYDFPQALSVQSNQEWTIENSAPDWVTVEGYTSNNRNQELRITVKENTSGALRTGELRFLVEGTVKQRYLITQTTAENATFTLKYDLNLRYNTINNWFYNYTEQTGGYYAGHITVFAKYTTTDAAAEIDTDAEYGYVTDAPSSANHLVVNDFRSNFFIFPNYNGKASSITAVNSSILSSEKIKRQNFFRQIIFDLPIPANVQRNQKIKYTVTINNITGTGVHDKAVVDTQIVNQ